MNNTIFTRQEIIAAAPVVMSRAHALARAARDGDPGISYRVALGDGLRRAWREARKLHHVSRLSDAEIMRVMGSALTMAGKRLEAKTQDPSRVQMLIRYNRGDLINSIAVKLYAAARGVRPGSEADLPLARAAARAASSALTAVYRDYYRHPVAAEKAVNDAGDEFDIIDLDAGRRASTPRADGPEAAYLKKEAAADIVKRLRSRVSSNAVDAFLMRLNGYSNKEIAAILGLNYSSVSHLFPAIDEAIKEIREEIDDEEFYSRIKNN